MMKCVRSIGAVMALLLGISGILLGFSLCFRAGIMPMQNLQLILPIIAGGLIAWWVGCRLAVPAPRPIRRNHLVTPPHFRRDMPERRRHRPTLRPQVVQLGRQVTTGTGRGPDLPAVALPH